jgi:plastocyanin
LEIVMRRLCLALVGGLVLTACGGGGGGGTGPNPNSIAVNAGNNQVGAAGAALAESLAVIVKDQSGAPLAGVNVTFAAGGGGSVSPTTRATDASGIAKTRRTLGPNAGTQTTSATAGSLAPAQFTAVGQINGAVNIVDSTKGVLSDTVGTVRAESLAVRVTDQTGTPVQGINVTWASASGTVSPTTAATNANGLSKSRFTYGNTAGNQTATATVTGLVGSPVTITLNGTAGTAVAIAKTGGDNGTAPPGNQVTYTVQSRDSHGNAKGGVTIDWAVATGGGSITPAQNTTQANGNASAQRTLGAGTGNQTATATATGMTGSPLTFTTNAVIITTIQVANNSFTPNAITVPITTTVTWEWQAGAVTHNVTFTPATGAPANITDRSTGSVPRTFNTAGTFNYHCTIHAGMAGSVTVTP